MGSYSTQPPPPRMSRPPPPQLQQPSPSPVLPDSAQEGGAYVPWHIRNPSPPQPVYAPEHHPSSSPQPQLQPHRPAPPTPANQRARFDETTMNAPYPYSSSSSHHHQYYSSSANPNDPNPPFPRTKPPPPGPTRSHSLSRSSSNSSLSSQFPSSSSEQDWDSDEKRRRDRKARKLGKSLSEVALEAVEEEKGRKRERTRRVWKWVGWCVGAVLEGWCLWLMIRYFVAFLLFLDDSQRRRLNLAFFIVSLYSCLTTLLPFLYLLPPFPSARPSRLIPVAHLLLALSSLSILAIAAVQIILFKLWENQPAPRGFVGRCGWDMDSVWGSPSECGSYRWEGWVGVLSARLAGSFVLIVLLHLSIVRYMVNSPPPIQLPTSPGAGSRASQQSLLPTTLIDRHHPRLLSEEFHRPQHHRQNSQPRSSHRSKRSSRNRGASSSARYQDESHSEPEMVEKSNRPDEQRFQTGYLRPVGGGAEDDEKYYGRPQTYVDLSEDTSRDARAGPWSSSPWGASTGRSFVGGVEDPPSAPVAAYIARKPVRYVNSASSHASSSRVQGAGAALEAEGSDFYHDAEEEDNVDDSDAYTPAPLRISRTPTFGVQPLPPTSPLRFHSNLPSLNSNRTLPLSPPRMTFPPPPDFSPPPPSQAKFIPPNRPPPPPPTAINTTFIGYSVSDVSPLPQPGPEQVDAFPSPPGVSFHRSPTLPSGFAKPYSVEPDLPNPYAYQYHTQTQHGLISPPSSDASSSSPSALFSSHYAPSPPPPREAPDLMLGSVWSDGDGDEAYDDGEEEFGFGRDAQGNLTGGERRGAMTKRLSTIASETDREE